MARETSGPPEEMMTVKPLTKRPSNVAARAKAAKDVSHKAATAKKEEAVSEVMGNSKPQSMKYEDVKRRLGGYLGEGRIN